MESVRPINFNNIVADKGCLVLAAECTNHKIYVDDLVHGFCYAKQLKQHNRKHRAFINNY